MKKRLEIILVLALGINGILSSQTGLLGSWIYSSQAGVMNMQISANEIIINNQRFPYQAQGSVLMINEGQRTTPYPFMLDGNQLTIEFPGGTSIVFSRNTQAAPQQVQAAPQQGQLPQSMARPSAGAAQGQNSRALTGKWVFRSQQGELLLEFLTESQLTFNGESTQYRLAEGVIQAMGDAGWIDYPYTLSQGLLTITFPDGTKIPFTRDSSPSAAQQGNLQAGNSQQSNAQQAGGPLWQLKGALCSWSGSSNSSSSYSRTQKIVFDGQGNFQFGSETSFSGESGIAYSGNPNIQTGKYTVGDKTVTLYFRDGTNYQVQVNMRQNNGMITELMYNGTLFATGLCN